MLKIRETRKKSIKGRLIIDFSSILIGICIFNYLLLSCIYQDVIYKKDNEKSIVVTNAALTQAKLLIKNSEDMMNHLMKMDILYDETITLEEKLDYIEVYADAFYDIGIISSNKIGLSIKSGELDLRNNKTVEKAFNKQMSTFDLIRYKDELYISIVRPITNESGEIVSLLLGVNYIEEFLDQIIEVSASEVCFIATLSKDVVMYKGTHPSIAKSSVTYNDEKLKKLLTHKMQWGEEYTVEAEDKETNIVYELNYGVLDESELVLGVINQSERNSEIISFRIALITSMFFAIVIGLIGIYIIANSLVKRMLNIANHLGGTIDSEFQETMPIELLENEDELGVIAKELKRLEDEIGATLDSIKDSLDYLNDKKG